MTHERIPRDGRLHRGEVVAPSRPADSNGTTRQALFDREWAWRLEQSPLLASSIGDHRFDDRLPDASAEAETRRAAQTSAFLEELKAIDREALPPDQRVNYDMFAAQPRERVDAHRFNEAHLLPLNADSGFHTSFALMPQSMRFASADDYETYLSRLRAFPTYVEQLIALQSI